MFILISSNFISLPVKAESSLKNTPISTRVIQDKQGFIWLATLNGLTRYNGESNLTFNSNNEDWPLPFNWVNDVYPLADNKLLLATETHKLWLFDTVTGIAKAIDADLPKKSIYTAIEHQGYYYLNIPDMLYQVNKTTLETKLLVTNINIKSLKKTKKNIYISTYNSVYKYNNNKLSIVIDEQITAIESTGDALIVATDKTLTVIDDNNITNSINIKTPIHAITKDNGKGIEGEHFYTINDEGIIKKYKTKSLEKLSHSYPSADVVKTKSMLHDPSGVLWLLTNQGIKQLTPKTTKNHAIVFDVVINSIELTVLNNKLIIGSYGGGLSAIDKTHPILSTHINQSLSKRARIITDLKAVDDNLYIATFDGLWFYNSSKKNLTRVDFINNNNLILDTSLKGDLLYIATNSQGFLIYNVVKKKLIKHIEGKRLSSPETINLLPLNNGSIWIANSGGIDVYNSHSDTVRQIKTTGQNKVISLLEYNGKIFVSTKGDGIFVYNLKGDLLSHFAKNLSFGYLSLINDEIWAPAQPGLYKINPESYQIEMLPHTEHYSFTDAPLLHNNAIYIGHYGGVLEVPLLSSSTYNPKVYISKTIVSGRSYLLNKSIKVNSPNDVITLELASLDYRPGKKKQYKYQINNGLWNDISGNNLTLTGLASGLYNIEIMATNSLGQWSESKAYTEINVAYPWYWTPNIRILYAILFTIFISMTCWLLYLRAKSISHIYQLLDVDLKTKGKSAQLVSRNITLAIEFIEKKEPIEKTKQLLQQSINELDDKADNNAPDNLYGNSLLMALPFLAEYVHKKYHVNLSIQLDIDSDILSYELQADIYKIIYEAITSAILNSNGRNFKVSMQEFKGKLWLTINDDSHSFTHFNSKINFDMAMYYIRQIAIKHKASVNTFDDQDNGSQLVISIPLMKIS